MTVKGIIEPTYDETDVHAVRAFQQGIANQAQQLRAWQFILTQCCRVQTEPFYEVSAAGGDHEAVTYALGRRAAGILILFMLNPEALDRGKDISTLRREIADQPEPPAKPKRFTRSTRQR